MILSLFPGIDMLGHAFESELDACVVRGPDVIYGSLSDIRTFHPPAGAFDGVIGGPPCQAFSALANLVRAKGHEPRSLAEMCRLQGVPPDLLDDVPWTMQGKRQAIANGVPMPTGRAVARAVRCALEELETAP